MNITKIPTIVPYDITTYRWTGNGWHCEGVRRGSKFGGGGRWRPCWWNNGVDSVLALTCPMGYVKGKLRTSEKSVGRGCVRCGRVFYSSVGFRNHECGGAK